MEPLIIQAFAGALISIGFAIIYNTPKNLLFWSALFGIIGLLVKFGSTKLFGFGIELSTFFGALAISIFTELHHAKSKEARRVLAVPPVLQMIPGKYAFETIVAWGAFWQHPNECQVLLGAVNMQLKTLLILIFLVLGIALPTILFKNRVPLKKVFAVANILHHNKH
ncbi:MAG: hypothetical protein RL154_172 [Pseudomonadota bacterium]|jgi:uncharacterized membrane protein YjjB (DUF3815 family)